MDSLNYIPLRATSQYSLLEGAMQIESIVKKAINHNIPAVGLTDRNNLFGALEFSEKLIDKGIQPIIGCNLSFYDQKNSGSIVCLAKNEQGYKNLIKLSSEFFLTNDDERLSLNRLSELNEGLILLTGGYGSLINNYLKSGLKKNALELTKKLNSIFQDRIYIEIQRMGKDDFENDLLDIANDIRLPVVASNTIFFESKDRFISHDALIAIKDSTTVNSSNREILTNEFYFKSPEEMNDLFNDMPEAINNTLEIAYRTSFKVSRSEPRLPRFSGLDSEGETNELVNQAKEGLKKKILENKITNEGDTIDLVNLDPKLIDYGEKVFKKCKACHRIGLNAKNGAGPHLNNIFGRVAGELKDYKKYSKSIRKIGQEGLIWNAETLTSFLENPKEYITGTKMNFKGIKKSDDLAALIEYLAATTKIN